jgi:hypothetical protein
LYNKRVNKRKRRYKNKKNKITKKFGRTLGERKKLGQNGKKNGKKKLFFFHSF